MDAGTPANLNTLLFFETDAARRYPVDSPTVMRHRGF